jgi:hypothetical protein
MNAHDGTVGGGRQGQVPEEFSVRRLPVTAEVRPLPVDDGDPDEPLRDAVERARRLSRDLDEPFRSLAFSALLEHLLGGDMSVVPGGPGRGTPRRPIAPPSTDIPLPEFLALRRLDSHPDRVVAIAYYHYHRNGGQGITTKDLVDAYTRSRAKRPQNFPDVIASCMRKGYLVDGGRRDGMKTWVVTRTGEAHVEQDL